MLDDLAREGAIIGQLTQIEAAGEVDDLRLDEGEVGGVAGGGHQEPLVAPDIVRHPVTPGAAPDILLRHPEARQHDPLLCQAPERRSPRRRKQQEEGREVVDPGEAKPAVAFAPRKQLLQTGELPRNVRAAGRCRQSTLRPDLHVEPTGDLFGPFVEPQAPDGVLLRRHLARLVDLALQIVDLHRHPEARVGLPPDSRVGPVITRVDGGDEGKPRIRRLVGQRPLQRLHRELVMLAAHRVAVMPGGGDLEDQRLASRARRRVELLDDLGSGMLMHLVHGGEVDVQPVHLAGIGRERAEPGGGRQDREVVDRARHPCRERRAGRDHAFRLAEDDPRLIARGRGGIDMGAGLAIGHQRIERDPGQQGRLAVLAGDLDIGRAEPPQPVGPFPAEDGAHHELLPRLQIEGLARPFARRVPQMAEELDRMQRSRAVPDKTARLVGLQIVQMALAGQPGEMSGHDLPGNHLAGPGCHWTALCPPSGAGSTLCCHGSENPRTDRGSRPAPPCGCGSGSRASARTRSRSGPTAPGTCWPPPETGSG